MQIIAEKIINDKDFLLVKDKKNYNKGFDKKKVFFMKNCGNNFVVLEVYNLSEYEEDDLLDEIEEKKCNIERILNSPVDYKIFKVFLTNGKVSDKVIDSIKSTHMHEVSMRKYVKPLLIDLENDHIDYYFDKNFPNDGILNILSENLNRKKWVEYDEKRIVDMDREKQKDYRITLASIKSIAVYTIVVLNVLVYIVAKMRCYEFNKEYIDVMREFGLMDGSLIRKGEYYRFLAPVFLHGDVIHLMLNCYSLLAVGTMCEKMYGNFKFLIIYLLSGIGGCIFSFALSNNLSLGASGAIFGVIGALLYFSVQKPVAFRAMFGKFLIGVILLNLTFGFCVTGVDNLGHIGGLIAGFLLAGIFRYSYDDKKDMRKICLILTTVIFGGLLYIGFR